MIDRSGIPLSGIEDYLEEVIAWVQDRIGDLENIEFDDPVFDAREPWRAKVAAESPKKRAVLNLILETRIFVRFRDGHSDLYLMPYGVNPMRRHGDKLAVELAIQKSLEENGKYTGDDVYVFDFESGWRINGVEGIDFGPDFRKFLDELEAKK
jgi:hypothetical protein